ncbi:TetR/AcrR family transcriptional regulator [Schumannella luteola]|uniref:AcrR family transcriptional regulator n=1 Tax=Schumannella luteola TaxID=472059 RepID=A0A852YFE4_9MICO|nr:TetR/AcrR family transcriptional regulator [Schumannella luteola]NYH00483.1 AcrR family transcriptional regulator [Schumannella luteola]TPX06258.1 TetR/AcrR family transcriptional regulator [Schumannella luteola]
MPDRPAARDDVRSRIVDVALALLRDEGASAVTTRAVADRAGVQAPTIYRQFGDKDGLLDAVVEQVMATYVAAKTEIVAAATEAEVDPVDELREAWDAQIAFGLANPSLFGLVTDPERARRSPAARSGVHVLRARVHRVALAGRLRVAEERAVGMIQAAGVGAVLAMLSRDPDDRDPGLAEALADALFERIIGDAPAQADRASTLVAFRAVVPELPGVTAGERAVLLEWVDRAIAES